MKGHTLKDQNILTLSFELQGDKMPVPAGKRVEKICDLVTASDASIVLTAGYAFETDADWDAFVAKLNETGWRGLVVSEIWRSEKMREEEGEAIARGVACVFDGSTPAIRDLGKQYVVTSEQIQSREGQRQLDQMCATLENRTFTYNGMQCGFLNCGEINVVRGRDAPTAVRQEILNWINGLDILFNPTHDAMGNHGTVNAKRRWISSFDGKERVYVSASNWNTQKQTAKGIEKQSRSRGSLHSTYFNGRPYPSKTVRDDICEARIYGLPRTVSGYSERPKGRAVEPLWTALKERYDQVLAEVKFPWLFVPDETERDDNERRIHAALVEHCRTYKADNPGTKKAECDCDALYRGEIRGNARSLEFDFYIPAINCAIEFDERQHFTAERRVALEAYPKSLKQNDWYVQWCEMAEKTGANDSDPPSRDWQRAFRDSIRDLRAQAHGVLLLRAYYEEDVRDILERIEKLCPTK